VNNIKENALWAFRNAAVNSLITKDDSALIFQSWDDLKFNLEQLRAIFDHPNAIHAIAIKTNPHRGSDFDDFLKEDGLFERVQARALKRALAEQLEDAMLSGNLSKVLMAQRMATSRSQLDRVLDPSNLSIQLDTLIKAAGAVGRTVEIRLKPQAKRTRTSAAQ
jgi:hypothetical protein